MILRWTMKASIGMRLMKTFRLRVLDMKIQNRKVYLWFFFLTPN